MFKPIRWWACQAGNTTSSTRVSAQMTPAPVMPSRGMSTRFPTRLKTTAIPAFPMAWELLPPMRMTDPAGPNRENTIRPSESAIRAPWAANTSGPNTPNNTGANPIVTR